MKKIKINYHFWWRVLPFIGLIVWGALCLTRQLWYDEAYSASMISHSWFDLAMITAKDDHSPFYYFLLKLFYHLFGGGTNFWSLKLMSLIFMMGYLMLGMFYVRKLFNEKISVHFMLFSILMPIMAVQAGNVRMYAVGLFFITLTGLTAYDIFLEPTRKKWIVFCLASLCGVYCHTFSMIQTFFLYLLFFGGILFAKKKHLIKGFFTSGIVVAILYSPWLWVTYHQMQLRILNDSGGRSKESIPTIYTFMDYCKEWFSAMETPIPIVIFAGMGLMLVLGYYAVDWMRQNKNYVPTLGMAAIGLTALFGVLASIYVNPCFLGRYAFPGFGAVALFYAVGMSQIQSKKMKTGVFIVALGCFLLQYSSELSLEYDNGLKTYEKFIEENVSPNDSIMGPTEHTIFLNVYHPDLQYYIYGYKLYSLPFKNTDSFTDWSQLEERDGNVWYICFEGSIPDKMEDRYDYEEAISFHYMYYDFVIYKLTHK